MAADAYENAHKGDTVSVPSMKHLAPNIAGLVDAVKRLHSKGIAIRFEEENLEFNPDEVPMRVLEAVGQFQRALVDDRKARQQEGIGRARLDGKFKGGNNKLKPDVADRINQCLSQGLTATEISRELGVSRQTVYKYAKALAT